jgi:phage I-like protein
MYLPASEHVSALTARLLQSDLEELLGRDIKPFIDFDHNGQGAAADPKRFVWKPGEGVFLRVAWTRSGKAAVEGKDYRYFSPALRVGHDGEIEGLPSNGAIGALVNRPGPSPMSVNLFW